MVEATTFVYNAEDKVLGRLASVVAKQLISAKKALLNILVAKGDVFCKIWIPVFSTFFAQIYPKNLYVPIMNYHMIMFGETFN